LTDPVGVPEGQPDITHTDAQSDGGGGRSRVLVALLLLLLLLMCAIATFADVFVTSGPDQVRFVVRNIECLQCHPELIPDLSRQIVHNPFMQKECTACHTRHGTEVVVARTAGSQTTWQRYRTVLQWLPLRMACRTYEGSSGVLATDGGGETTVVTKKVKGADSHLVAPLTELCWVCHGNMGPLRNMPFQHAPFQNGYCTNCHDPHASDWKGMLSQDPRSLCITCHPIGRQLSRAQVHPPAGNLYCTNCHNPHASDWKGILVKRQRDLCFVCHPTVASLSMKAYQHAPFLNDNCTGCHEPHGSDYLPLLRAEQPRLCYNCHPEIQNDFNQVSHHPVGAVELTCSDCHDPHAADYQFLLDASDNAFCYECHSEPIEYTYEKSAHRHTLCIRCHTPHGSSYAPLLRQPDPRLCLTCHGWVDRKNGHPVTPRFYDRHADKPLTCASSCHNPHGTQYPNMVNYPYRRDGLCLWCHPGVGVTF
jgi:predicted CXXCH cytochrome family protein